MQKKIGIITFHRAINYGAILQAYALQEIIKEKTNLDVEVIDYRCTKLENDYKVIKGFKLKQMVALVLNLNNTCKTRKQFRSFRNKRLNLSESYNENNIIETNTKFTHFITGSDQVWNYRASNFDSNYFLEFVNNNNKLSYAASFGFETIPTEYKKDYNRLLSTFKHISVREKAGQAIIDELLDKQCDVVLDPTLLLSSKDWFKIIDKKPIISEKYVLIYGLILTKDMIESAKKVAQENNYKVYFINNSFRNLKGIHSIRGVGPSEFLNLMYYANYVVTDSFHGTAFSINFNKQFHTELSKKKDNVNSRIVNLFTILGINNQCDKATSWLEFAKVNCLLEENREKSIKTLTKYLE